jgi:hypothetical protein
VATHATAAADPFTPTQITLLITDSAGKPIAGDLVTSSATQTLTIYYNNGFFPR